MATDDAALKLWVVLSRAHAAVGAHAEADVARHGISLADFEALEALYHKGALLVGELQRAVLKSSGGMTYALDRLEKKGLITRRPCKEDRRATYAELTAEGRTLMDRIFPLHTQSLVAAQVGLTEDEKRTAIELLKKLGLAAAQAPLPARKEKQKQTEGATA